MGAADPLNFQLNLTGNFAPQLAPANAALATFQGQLKATAAAAPDAEKKVGDALKKTGDKGRSFFTFDIASAARSAYDAVARITSEVFRLGVGITHIVGDFQDLKLAMKLNLGDAGAEMLQGIADSFGSSRFDDDLINKALIPFAEMGIKDRELLDRIATAASDMSARLNTGDAGLLSATEAFKKIALKGEVDARALRELQIGEADYYKNLGGFLKVSAKQAEELAKKGKIESDVLIATALDEVAKRQGGKLGVGTNAAGKTLGGTLARLGNLPANVFKQLEGSDSAKALQSMLERILEFGNGPGGKRIVSIIDSTFMGIVKLATAAAPLGEALLAAFGGAVDGARALGRAFDVLGTRNGPGFLATVVMIGGVVGDVFRAIGLTIEGVVTAVDEFVDALGNDFRAIGEFFTSAWRSYMAYFDFVVSGFNGLGGRIVDGLIQGIADAWVAGKEKVNAIWSSVITDAKAVFKIQSPSLAFEQIGDMTAEGLAQGLEGGRSRVETAAASALADSVFSGMRRMPQQITAPVEGGGNGGGVRDVIVHYQAAPGMSSQDQAREIAELIREEVALIFDEVT